MNSIVKEKIAKQDSSFEVGLVTLLNGTEADLVCHIRTELDISRVRLLILKLTEKTNITQLLNHRLLTAVSELGWNALKYAGGGVLCAWLYEETAYTELIVKVADEGPGITDVEWALTEKNSTGNSLGLGLSGTKRLVDSMEIWSPIEGLGHGTLVVIKLHWKNL